MESLINISLVNCYSNYALFYILAFLVGSMVVLFQGLKRGYPVIPFIMLLFSGILCGTIGARLGSLNLADWTDLFQRGVVPAVHGKTFPGFIIGGFAGILFFRRFLGFRHSVADLFAMGITVGMIIMRMGCLTAGCCFGKPTTLPWAITYGSSMPAFQFHRDCGWIASDSATSLPVHPTQFYEILLLSVVLLLLITAGKKLHRPGSSFLLFLITYFGGRFFIEFSREGGTYLFGLKTIQWFIIIIVPLFSLYLIMREKKSFVSIINDRINPGRIKIGFLLLSALVIFNHNFFTSLERTAILMAGIILFIVSIPSMFPGKRFASILRLGTSSLLLLAFIHPPEYEQGDSLATDTFEIQGNLSRYRDICRTPQKAAAVGFEKKREKKVGGKNLRQYSGIRLYYVSMWSERYNSKQGLIYASPFFGFNSKRYGIGSGIVFSLPNFYNESHILISPNVRFGDRRKLYVEFSYFEVFPFPYFILPMARVSIGRDFGESENLNVGFFSRGLYLGYSSDITNRLYGRIYLGVSPLSIFSFPKQIICPDEWMITFSLGMKKKIRPR